MTLNVSLCVPDGIVIASDSLLTITEHFAHKMNVDGECPECLKNIQLKDVQLPTLTIPSSTFPYAQKLFSLRGKVALAGYGSAFVNGRSMYNHVTELSAKLPDPDITENYLEKVKDAVLKYFDEQLASECNKTGMNLMLQPDNWCPFGFQLVGFARDLMNEPTAKVYWIKIGKKSSATINSQPALCTGDPSVVRLLWPNGELNANIHAFSLQDAIDYVKFLIRTTADYQRFSGKMPTVGGEIDIALITNLNGFQWIAQKELYKKLESK